MGKQDWTEFGRYDKTGKWEPSPYLQRILYDNYWGPKLSILDFIEPAKSALDLDSEWAELQTVEDEWGPRT